MAGDFRRQAAKRGREYVGQRHGGKQCAGDLTARMTRPWEETLSEERYDEQQGQYHAAEPPGGGSPEEAQRGLRKNLKKENAGCRQYGAREKKTGAKNE